MAESGNPESPHTENVTDMAAYRRRRSQMDYSGHSSQNGEQSEGLSDTEFAEERLSMWAHASYSQHRSMRILSDFVKREDPDDESSPRTPTAERLVQITSDAYLAELGIPLDTQRRTFERAALEAITEIQRHALEAVYRVHLASITPDTPRGYFNRHLRSLVDSIVHDTDTPPDVPA